MKVATHRGKGTAFRENSLSAFEDALSKGASILETDIRATKDHVLVLIHNKSHPRFLRKGMIVSEHSFEDLVTEANRSSVQMETFGQLFERFRSCEYVLDIKWRNGEKALLALRNWAHNGGVLKELQEKAYFLLWLPQHVELARSLFSELRLVANRVQSIELLLLSLIGHVPKAKHGFALVAIPAIVFRIPPIARRVIRNLKEPGVALMLYLPTSQREVSQAVSLGIDIVMTDDFQLTGQR